jgi:CheY-like chemotaxis protein
VLLVEDNEINRRVALGLLHARGHQVVVAENGLVAVHALTEQQFDVVLMDMQMPVMDGYEATTAIRNREHQTGGHVPIVAMTAEALKGDRERCLELGMDDYVAKPIVAADMYRAVERFPAICLASEGRHLKDVGDGSSRMEHGIERRDLLNSDRSEPPQSPAVTHAIDVLPKIDWTGIKELLTCGFDELRAFADVVREEIPSQVCDIRHALGAYDAKLLRRSAHSLKGSVSYFGVVELMQAALALELSGREESFERTVEQLATLEREVARFLVALEIGPPDSIF